MEAEVGDDQVQGAPGEGQRLSAAARAVTAGHGRPDRFPVGLQAPAPGDSFGGAAFASHVAVFLRSAFATLIFCFVSWLSSFVPPAHRSRRAQPPRPQES